MAVVPDGGAWSCRTGLTLNRPDRGVIPGAVGLSRQGRVKVHLTATPPTLTRVATSVFPVAANGGLEVTRELARKGGHVAARPGREAGSERCRRCELPGSWASDGTDELRRALAGLMQQRSGILVGAGGC
jgi:hypothetical protein